MAATQMEATQVVAATQVTAATQAEAAKVQR